MAISETRLQTAPETTRLVNTLHQGIPVRDLDAATRFYTEVLGLPIMPRPNFPRPGVWLGYPGGDVEIHLTLMAEAPQLTEAAGPGNRHTAFGVTDLSALKARLESLNVPFFVQAGFIQSDQIFINDPDGNTLEFQQV
jgi:catechol 2,3-dioxygenase-like lactoylglutathione lyase family enzyme